MTCGTKYVRNCILLWIGLFWFFMWFLSGCVTTQEDHTIGTLCDGFHIEFHSKQDYPTIPIETLNQMMRTCYNWYQGCLYKVIQRGEDNWWAVCKMEDDHDSRDQ